MKIPIVVLLTYSHFEHEQPQKFLGLHFIKCQFSDPLKFDFVIPHNGYLEFGDPPPHKRVPEFSDPPHGFVSP